MKNYLLLMSVGLGLLACQKSDQDAVASPKAISTAFGQDFTLAYQQSAHLPSTQQPELTINVADIKYTYCPPVSCSNNPSLTCLVGTYVYPVLSIMDAAGRTQQVQLPANQPAATTPAWLDTTSVRANGRRYLLHYVNWQLNTCNPQREDIAVTLRVTSPL
ncbi:hypothetical protein [Hymenobacter sediminicola]|uniref:Uncharacterized protein n=1 Tax=Hymenobacter sediminicola TaxID=2761579 RepID=A0A7G7WBE3_9BACT|nr:hypothetical protein [Hymenobacter sediminicola]QNH63686.1 hypothetical protein H4317_07795 [Hymenobacter sediminicola]